MSNDNTKYLDSPGLNASHTIIAPNITNPMHNMYSNITLIARFKTHTNIYKWPTSELGDDEQHIAPKEPQLLTHTSRTPTPLQQKNKAEFNAILFGSFIMAANAGYINAITIATTQTGTSHVTGTLTRAAISASRGDGAEFLTNSGLVTFFILGASITGILFSEDYISYHASSAQQNAITFMAFIMILALIVEAFKPNSIWFDLICCMVCGLQNAMTTKYSGAILRTTHMTGVSTDLGFIFGQNLRKQGKQERWKIIVFSCLLLGFFIGGMMGEQGHRVFGRFALATNVVFLVILGFSYTAYMHNKRGFVTIPIMKQQRRFSSPRMNLFSKKTGFMELG